MSNPHIGVKDGRLAACPQSPNCVSTQAEDESKQMSPLPFHGGLNETKKLVKELIHQMDRTSLEDDSENYLHVIVTSKILKFKDDVEFYFDETGQVVHFRSASRTGYSDFGVNRKRMESFSESYDRARAKGGQS
ncbi:DUF1499 domain-containing protein [Halobacillus locisalis]|uniref:DUF1499 domain-containing protein n=1 Tax=Halobacillus locisalis TaxID=220753 RepID=A0A838CRR5_9BACI|nr:DUF1499 domain-containing protein [Halobacillus locisalis]MBA2174634.1 DUF1499 domain-containing protein [Halobacillus locisalis]